MKSPTFSVAVSVSAAALLLLALAPSARAQEMPLKDYQDLLSRYQDVAESTKPLPQKSADVARELRAVKSVALPDGKTVAVDLSQDADVLTNPPAKDKTKKTNTKADAQTDKNADKPFNEPAAARAGVLAALVVWDKKFPDAAEAEKQAAEILARPEFQIEPEKPETQPTWIQSIGEWFKRQFRAFGRWIAYWWNRLFPHRNVAPGGLVGLAEFVRFLLYFAVGVGTLVGLYFLAMYLSGKRTGNKKTRGTGATGLDLDLNEFPDPLGYAREVAARGDYREAVRLVYIASLRRLAGSGLVVLQENRTNWEYQRALRSRSQNAYDILLPGTRLFDRIWYGRQSATQAEYEQTVALHDSLPDPTTKTTGVP